MNRDAEKGQVDVLRLNVSAPYKSKRKYRTRLTPDKGYKYARN